MNYIELINWFWICDEVWEFTATETRLYMYLLKVANALSWQQNPFWHSDGKTSIGARCSINSMKTARNRLLQAGLIKVEPGGKGYGNKSRYQILTPKSLPNHIPKHAPLIKLKETKLNLIPPLVPPGEKTRMIKFEIPDLEKPRIGIDNSPPPDTDLPERKRKKVPPKKEKDFITELSKMSEITESKEQLLTREIRNFSIKSPLITAQLIKTMLKGEVD